MKIHTIFVACAIAMPAVMLGAGTSSITSLTKDELTIQRLCIAGNDTCRYMDMHLSSTRELQIQAITYFRIDNAAMVVAFNKMIMEREKTDPISATTARSVAMYDPTSKKWLNVAGMNNCTGCLIPERILNLPGTHWIRLIAVGRRVIPSNSYFVKTVAVSRYQHSYVKVHASAAEGIHIYADERLNGTHMPVPMRRPDGTFVALMKSEWIKSELPDYITVSTMPSYRTVAHTYHEKEQVIVSSPNNLPTFTGNGTDEIINKVVKYISSRKLNGQVDTFGAFPSHGVDEILKSESADCKDYATLLIAALHKSGIPSYPVLFNQNGLAPLSFTVPSHWSNHVIVYVPKIKKFIDMTAVVYSHGQFGWAKSASLYAGDIALDTISGNFIVIQ